MPAAFSHTSRPTTAAPGLLLRSATTNSKLRCVAIATIVFVQDTVGNTIAAALAASAAATATDGTTTKP
ncbi:hypothetical protein DEO72_LG10g1271 [Vigna unguiculata]|uniref:Uncharacterized protein n=1 Tax=Vigna unguiculata TaxID=3917 RepID=A0A4D6ND35_VIGUN|nr:hypothetical protein DEO72_LG10g1271 [Vigna unguiculata]